MGEFGIDVLPLDIANTKVAKELENGKLVEMALDFAVPEISFVYKEVVVVNKVMYMAAVLQIDLTVALLEDAESEPELHSGAHREQWEQELHSGDDREHWEPELQLENCFVFLAQIEQKKKS